MNPLYTRHYALKEFGASEQNMLSDATVLLVGLGGLGHLAATYLCTAGAGRLILNDFDTIDVSNLQRQFLYSATEAGKNKAITARQTLSALNPDVNIEAVDRRLSQNELTDLCSTVNLILDCSDNFGTRFAVNRAAVHNSIPLVSGAAIRFEGQISSFHTLKDKPCYQCLFPESHEEAEDCAGNGVLAPVTGVIASSMCVEAIKILTGIGSPLYGRLQLYNGKNSTWKEVRYSKDPRCEVCSI